MLDIYATRVDYDPRMESSILFFKTVQNKMHRDAHGQTAAEKIYDSANADKPYMGILTFKGEQPKQADALIAENYCIEDELSALNSVALLILNLLKLSKHEILTV